VIAEMTVFFLARTQMNPRDLASTLSVAHKCYFFKRVRQLSFISNLRLVRFGTAKKPKVQTNTWRTSPSREPQDISADLER